MFKGLRDIEISDLVAVAQNLYLLRNVRINTLVGNQEVIKIGRTDKAVSKRIRQYTFAHNQPHHELHAICLECGIRNARDFQSSWEIRGEWSIPSGYSAKRVEESILSQMTAVVRRDRSMQRFGGSEYFSIDRMHIDGLVEEIDLFVQRLCA